jgi:hypothetical protein
MTEHNLHKETQEASDEVKDASTEAISGGQDACADASESSPEPADAQKPKSKDSRGVPLMPEGPIEYSPNRRNWHAMQSDLDCNEEPCSDEEPCDEKESPVAPVAPVAPVLNTPPNQPPHQPPAQELQMPGESVDQNQKLSGGQKALYFFLGFLFGAFGLLGVFIYCSRKKARGISRAALNWTAIGVIISMIINFIVLFSGADVYAMYEQYLEALGMHESAEVLSNASPSSSGSGIF